MAKRIIVLQKSQSETTVNYSCLFWFPIASGIRTQSGGSQWVPNGASVGASAAENTAIQNGSVLEENFSFSFPKGVALATIQDDVLAAWTNRNAQINGIGPNERYGTFNDSVTNWGSS